MMSSRGQQQHLPPAATPPPAPLAAVASAAAPQPQSNSARQQQPHHQQQQPLQQPLLVEDLACPICVETIEDAFATPCGHTFCFKCISTHLKNKSTCPTCGTHLVQDQIHPNFLLSKLIQRAATAQQSQSLKTALLQHVQRDLAAAGPSIGLQELDAAIQLLQDKRQQVATHESGNKLQLLMLFLQHAKARQLGQLSELEQQLDVLQQDLSKARAAAGDGGSAGGGADGLQPPQQQQPLQAPAAAAAAVVPAAPSPVTPPSQDLQQQSEQPPAAAAAGAVGSDAVPVGSSSRVGGPGSAFTRVPPVAAVAASQPQQQPPADSQQQQPQATTGFRPLPQPQQQQQGFRPLPTAQPPQQQLLPVNGGSRGFRPFTPAPQLQQQQQQFQQQQLLGSLNPAAAAAGGPVGLGSGFRPYSTQPQGLSNSLPEQQQQQQQPGFRPLQSTQQQPQQQQQQQGFRPLPQAPQPQQQGLVVVEATLNPDKKRKILEQFDELQQAYLSSRLQPRRSSPGSTPAAAAAAAQAGGAGSGGGGGGGLPDQQQQQQQQEEVVSDVNVAVGGGGVGAASSSRAQANPQAQGQQQQAGLADLPGNGLEPAAAAADAAADADVGAAAAVSGGGEEVLNAFSRMLYAVTHFSRLEAQAYVPPPPPCSGSGSGRSSSAAAGAAAAAAGSGGGAQILSSVDFDCGGKLFAAAGVQQRIFVHDYQSVLTHGGPPNQQQQQGDAAPPAAAAAIDSSSSSASLLPLLDLPTASKVSCVNFSPAVQQYLLSSDYAGVVQLWDLTGGRTVRQWEAHDKRIWSVDFCPLDATTFATGSDDGTVKVWGLCEAPVPRLTLPVRANVCSIKFSPAAPHMLAAGNAGHQVHLFDLRSPRSPLAVLKGHNKAVSYVRWAGPDTLVTASTDSTLRLWTASGGRGSSDTGAAAAAAGQAQQQQHYGGATSAAGAAAGAAGGGAQQQQGGSSSSWDCEGGGWRCCQEFKGHQNSKHFVGLATQGPFIACGSETNEVYMYHQGLAHPSLKCALKPWEGWAAAVVGGSRVGEAAAAGAGAGGGGGCEGAAGTAAAAAGGAGDASDAAAAAAAAGAAVGSKSPFVSALCWKKDSDVLLAANSKGGIWVLSMQ